MERVFNWVLAAGYPKAGVDWLRQRRLLILIVLGTLSWMLFIALGWLLFTLVA